MPAARYGAVPASRWAGCGHLVVRAAVVLLGARCNGVAFVVVQESESGLGLPVRQGQVELEDGSCCGWGVEQAQGAVVCGCDLAADGQS